MFVLGEVQQGGLIGKPAKGSKNKIFVISHKSKEERTTSLTKKARWLLIFIVLSLGGRRRPAGVVGGEGEREEGRGLRHHAARLSAPPSRSSAASSVASRLAKQKRTTERIGSLA